MVSPWRATQDRRGPASPAERAHRPSRPERVRAQPEPHRLERRAPRRPGCCRGSRRGRTGERTTPAGPCAARRTGSGRARSSCTISSISPSRTSPSGRKMPGGAALAALGDHLPGAGAELGWICSTHPYGGMIAPVSSLEPTSDRTVNSLRQSLDQLELALVLDRDRPVGDLEVLEARARAATRSARRGGPG